MTEKSIFASRAVVYYFDAGSKNWVPTQVGNNFCRIDLYENTTTNTFRVIGRGLDEEHKDKIVINSNISKETLYQKASDTFHKWADARYIYGLNFTSSQEAETFFNGFQGVINRLKGSTPAPAAAPPPNPPVQKAPTPSPAPQSVPSPKAAPTPPSVPTPPPGAPPGAPPPPELPKASKGTPRGALLDSIQNFKKNGLKPTTTVDKSVPVVAKTNPPPTSTPQPGGGGGGGGALPPPVPGGGGDMMAQIMAKRKQMMNQSSATPPPGPISSSSTPTPKPPSQNSLQKPLQRSGSQSGSKFTNPAAKAVANMAPKRTPSQGPPVDKTYTPPDSAPSSGSRSEELQALKEEIMDEVRRELQAIKEELLAAIKG